MQCSIFPGCFEFVRQDCYNQPMKYSERINALCEMLPACRCLADVGCDHGKLLLCALQAGKAERGIASDISAASLQKAAGLFRQHAQFDVRLHVGDGLDGLDDADCAAMAGMGGVSIIQMLAHKHVRRLDALLLQPADNAAELRRWLAEQSFAFVAERIIMDTRYYPAMLVQPGGEPCRLSLLEAEVGPLNAARADDNTLAYAKWRLDVHRKTLCQPARTPRGQQMQRHNQALCTALEEYIGEHS